MPVFDFILLVTLGVAALGLIWRLSPAGRRHAQRRAAGRARERRRFPRD